MNDFEIIIGHYPEDLYQRLDAAFDLSGRDVIVSYGDKVYASGPLTPDLVEHEGVHCKRQQMMGLDAWWNEYLRDPQFRLDEEVLAYKAQYRWIERNVRDRNRAAGYLMSFAKDLASPMYGSIVDYPTALKLIRG